ncbi:MAG: polyribonucleotide nucleotidyltransferase [Patescibacteria group bacterium]
MLDRDFGFWGIGPRAHAMQMQEFSLHIDGEDLIIKKSILAGQANGSIIASLGDTMVLATAVIGKAPREGVDFFPLMVDYEERLYAAGKISGSRFIKREGRASTEAILTSRLIDRTLRPLFDNALRHEVQVVVTVLSWDQKNDADTLSIIAASSALAISDIPWGGPVGAVRIGRVDGTLIVNPSYEQRKISDLDVVFSGTTERINMIEGDALELPEDVMLEAFSLAQRHIADMVAFQHTVQKAIGIPKKDIERAQSDTALAETVRAFLGNQLAEALFMTGDKRTKYARMSELHAALAEHIAATYPDDARRQHAAAKIFDEEVDRIVHEKAIHAGQRPDGRRFDELRDISCDVSFLPRTHGTGVFVRGETQVLSILTLGSPGDQQLVDTMEAKEQKRFMHHYNFPPFSVGEVKPLRGPSRRDIGHGMLAERAMMRLIPEQKDFPYTIRLVSETLSSNGSSSMASVCASMLALMDGGVPVTNIAAGIAMGLMSDDTGNYKVLTDIQGPEDHHGDMDLKVAGTDRGITAIQMDVKIDGITLAIFRDTITQAKKARHEILDKMKTALPAPRAELSRHAPRIITLEINPEKIKDVIGPGGKIINEIIDETGVSIDIEDNGLVFITSVSAEAAAKAVDWIKNITREAKVGEVFQGKVKKIMDFGAFVELFPGTEGLVHISKLADYRVARVEDVVKIGDIIPVKLMEIDSQGRLNLSHKDALTETKKQ